MISTHQRMLVGLIAIASAVPARADIILEYDMDPLQLGIQTELETSTNAQFDVGVLMRLTEAADSIGSYGFRVRYDADELDFIGRSDSPPPTFSTQDGSVSNRSGNNDSRLGVGVNFQEIDIVALGTPTALGGTPLQGPTNHVLVTLTFKANTLVSGDIDMIFDASAGDGFLSGSFLPVTVETGGMGGVNAVPEPSSLILSSMAALPLVFLRRHRRRGHHPPARLQSTKKR